MIPAANSGDNYPRYTVGAEEMRGEERRGEKRREELALLVSAEDFSLCYWLQIGLLGWVKPLDAATR